MAAASGSLRPVSLSVTFLPGAVAAIGGWAYLGRPLDVPGANATVWHLAGLSAMVVTGLIVWPVLALVLLFLVPAALRAGFVPRDWRKRYRKRLISKGVPRDRQRSAYISDRLSRVTKAADRHRCVACHARIGDPRVPHLEVDHVMPWSLGALTTLFNCMTLCPVCNKIKSNYWRFRSGHRVYVPFDGWANEARAAEILHAELRHRWNPGRWVRAALELAA